MPAESVQARAVITRPAPRPATAGLAPLAGHVLFPPGQAARRHPDGGTAIAHHHARQRMPVRSNGPRARDLGPAHRHGRPSLASPRAVSAGRSRLIRTVSHVQRHSGRPRPPATDLADYQGSKQATDPLDRLICAEFPDLHGLRLDRNQANARADRSAAPRALSQSASVTERHTASRHHLEDALEPALTGLVCLRHRGGLSKAPFRMALTHHPGGRIRQRPPCRPAA
jgi:hypothetical protein